jgi:hypothetical protein
MTKLIGSTNGGGNFPTPVKNRETIESFPPMNWITSSCRPGARLGSGKLELRTRIADPDTRDMGIPNPDVQSFSLQFLLMNLVPHPHTDSDGSDPASRRVVTTRELR